jgi:hypothetical protein
MVSPRCLNPAQGSPTAFTRPKVIKASEMLAAHASWVYPGLMLELLRFLYCFSWSFLVV